MSMSASKLRYSDFFVCLKRWEQITAPPVLQRGLKQVAAGYVVYGSSTIFVYTAGQGVFGFTLSTNIGAFVLSS